jgi:hypothetical protein
VTTSISRRIVISLTVTIAIATLCEYGWLYLKAEMTAVALRERSLIDQAKDIGNFLVINRKEQPELVLPTQLAEAYNNSESSSATDGVRLRSRRVRSASCLRRGRKGCGWQSDFCHPGRANCR